MPNAYSVAVVRAAVVLAAKRQALLAQARQQAAVLEPDAYTDRTLRRRRAYEDPQWFVEDILGLHLYAQQIDMILAVRAAAEANREQHDPAQVSVVGANGVGKDFNIGRAVIPWWVEVFEPAKVLVTAPTGRQVFDIVWQELRTSFNSAVYPLRGRMLPKGAEWDVGLDSFVRGFSTDKGYSLLGYHSPHLLAIVSEAHAFEDGHMTNIRRLLPQVLMLSGNPLAEAGTFYMSHHDNRDQYRTISISAWDSPNVINGTHEIPGLVTRDDIAQLADAWGVPYEELEDLKETGQNSAAFDSTVNGNFSASPDGLIKLAWIQNARGHAEPIGGVGTIAGLDVAGPGEDETCLVLRQHNTIIGQWSWLDADPRGEVVAKLLPFKTDLTAVNVDVAGIGYYLGLHLKDQGFNVNMVNVGHAARDTEKYVNLKAELYWGLRMRFERGDVDGIDDNITAAQLASIKYKLNPRGQVEIERKEDLKKRIGKSPDRAEAIMLAYAYGDGGSSTAALRESFQAGGAPEAALTREERNRRDDRPRNEGRMKEF